MVRNVSVKAFFRILNSQVKKEDRLNFSKSSDLHVDEEERIREARPISDILHSQPTKTNWMPEEREVGRSSELCMVEYRSAVRKYYPVAFYLEHELGDDPVEGGSLVSESLLPGAETAEVLRGLGGDVGAQLHDDAAEGLAVGGDVEVDLVERSSGINLRVHYSKVQSLLRCTYSGQL